MRKALLLLWIFILPQMYGQLEMPKKPSRIFHSWGTTLPMLDLIQTPSKTFSTPMWGSNNYNQGGTIYPMKQTVNAQGFSVISLQYNFRYNFAEINKEIAFAYNCTPSIGVGAITFGDYQFNNSLQINSYGIFQLPVQIEMEMGAGSTYLSESNHGFTLGCGLAYMLTPLISPQLISQTFDANGNTLTSQTMRFSYVQVVASTGFRYFDRYNNLNELNVLIGFVNGSNGRLSWINFLRY